MAWTTPITAAANSIFQASQWNASVRDNILQTGPAKTTSTGWVFSSEAANLINQHEVNDSIVTASETTASTSYVNLATTGPTCTIGTGNCALIWINCQNSITGANQAFASLDLNALGAADSRAIIKDGAAARDRWGTSILLTMTPGSNVFTMKYRVTAGTGTFERRRMQVMGM